MAKDVIMPALGMAQETGTLIRWLKAEGEAVREGEPIAEIQTDKATVELEARASGVLSGLHAQAGEDVPVGRVIATIAQPGEQVPAQPGAAPTTPALGEDGHGNVSGGGTGPAVASSASGASGAVDASPVASRMAAEHGVDLRDIQINGRRVQKADVLAYMAARGSAATIAEPGAASRVVVETASGARLAPASPKARRLAGERGITLTSIRGSGPAGAVLARDVLAAPAAIRSGPSAAAGVSGAPAGVVAPLSAIWRVMAERTTRSWQEIPHFFLFREVNASRMIAWRETARRQRGLNMTYTDLLVKAVADTLRAYPGVNASWRDGGITRHVEIHIGVAVATNDGLVVPVIHHADQFDLAEIAAEREALVTRAQAGKQRPDDLMGATFTISNLGMYGVDAFNAIVPGPQAAILAVGRIADRVVPLNSVPAVQPMMMLSLSCDHRVIDGARGAPFLGALADLLEEPLALLR